MDDNELQELLFTFLERRGGYVAAASERELFLLLKAVASDAARQERARVLQAIKDVSYDATEMCARQNGDEYSAEAGFEQARQVIYSAILALPD
jgi:hypothetical protein